MSLAQARRTALQRLNEVANGKDPAGEKRTLREAETFGEISAMYLEHAETRHCSRLEDTGGHRLVTIQKEETQRS
jgi:predicted outer membrane lipoprotein